MNSEAFSSNQHYPVWGLLGTLIWGLIITVIFFVTQIVAMGIFIGIIYGDIDAPEIEKQMVGLQYDGLVLSICTFASLLVCGLLILGIIKLKKGANLKHYLGFRAVSLKDLKFWLAAFTGLIIVSDLLTFLLGRPIVPEFMTAVYTSIESKWILWLALIVAAPVFEEMFFRGFLISGISPSILGPVGAIVISSAMWAAIHLQYDLYGFTTIFIMGLVLGLARIKTGSTLLTIVLHSFANLVATVEAVISLS